MRNTYREYQKLDERVRLVLLVAAVISACFLILCNYLNFTPHVFVLILSFILALSFILTVTFKFSIVIYPERIYLTFWPFFKTSIKISTIAEMKIIDYNIPGFGVRYDIPNSVTYYKASGNTALSITLVNHKTVVIGTRRPTEILKHLEQLKLQAAPAPN
jgi:hypothetical protein